MKMTINDVPPKDGLHYRETITDEQYAELTKLGEALRGAARDERYFNVGEEIEAVKIEAAYINHGSKMTAIKFRFALKPFLRYTGHLSPDTIRVSVFWGKNNRTISYTGEDVTSEKGFPHSRSRQLDLKTDNHEEEVIKLIFEALALTIESTSESLHNESYHLEELAKRVRRADRNQQPAE
jgi:hypothetical protein